MLGNYMIRDKQDPQHFIEIHWFLGLQGTGKREDHLLYYLLWWLYSWSVMRYNLLLTSSGWLTQLLCNTLPFVIRTTSN